MTLKIKVCGMKYESNINDLSLIEPDYMGFIFYPKSKRFVGVDFDKNDLNKLSSTIQKTAVFVNAHLHEIKEFCGIYGIKTVQLHGNETPEFCASLKADGFTILKAFGVDEGFDFFQLNKYEKSVSYFLFDTKTSDFGGSGKVFNWEVLQNYKLEVLFFLSGGLRLENINAVKNIKHPQFYGVDLNSRFEIEPGLKNIDLLEEAFKIIRL